MGHAVTDELFEARYDQRKWLHVAAVMSNNFITHLMTICDQIDPARIEEEMVHEEAQLWPGWQDVSRVHQ